MKRHLDLLLALSLSLARYDLREIIDSSNVPYA